MPRIALIGCGRWGRNILRDLLALGCDVAVADPDPVARSHAESVGVIRLCEHLRDLPETDGIVIATLTSMHAEVISAVLERGVPIFVEKPMTCNVSDARSLAVRADGRLFVMDKWRYHPGVEELRRVRESGEFGRALGMHLRHLGWGHPHVDVDVIWILAPHCLSIVLEVFGFVPDVKHAFSEPLDGEAVTLTAVLGGDPWVTMEVSSRSPIKRREFRLHCESGVAWLDEGWSDHIKIARGIGKSGGDASNAETRHVGTELPLQRELRAFVDHVTGGAPPRSSAKEGALIVERIHQMRQLAGLDA